MKSPLRRVGMIPLYLPLLMLLDEHVAVNEGREVMFHGTDFITFLLLFRVSTYPWIDRSIHPFIPVMCSKTNSP